MEDLKKIQEFFSKPLEEVTKSQMLKKAKKGSYPATLVAIENGKVVAQEKVSTPQEAPAAHSVMSKKYPNANIRLEDSTGKILEENVDKKYSDFLSALRDSGITNMFGAAPYLQAEFGLDKREAREVLANWMRSFGESLNENAFVEAFKLEKALKGMGYDVKVKYLDDFGSDVFEIYFQNPADADESIFYDAKKLGYDNVRVFANPNESVKEAKKLTYNDFVRMVRDDMMAGAAPDEKPSEEQVKKKAKAYYNEYLQGASVDDLFEATKEEETEFHKKLDKLVHDTFGKRKGEMEEYNTGIYYDPAKERNAVKEVPKKTFFSILKDIKNLALKLAKDNAKEASQYIKSGKAAATNPMADIAKVQQDLMGQAQLDEGIKDAINNITKFSGAGSLLTGGGYLLSYLDQLELKYYQWYYGKIKEMADFEIFELLKNKYGIEEQISTWEQKVLMYAFFVFFTIFIVAIGAKLVSKGISKLKKEALSDYEEEEANYDELYGDYKYKVNEAKPKKGHGEKISKEVFAKLKGKTINYKGQDYKVVDSDEAVLTLKDEDGKSKTINLRQFNVSGMIDEIMETIELGKTLEEKLCKKGEAYRKKRIAAGEKSSAYLNGRAVKVCKGQMKG